MATVYASPDGRLVVQFRFGRKRHTLRLGRCGALAAANIAKNVGELVAILELGLDPDKKDVQWIRRLPLNIRVKINEMIKTRAFSDYSPAEDVVDDGISQVYFAACDKLDEVKIGVSTEARRRIKSFGTTYPGELYVLGLINGDRDVEQHIHQILNKHRIRGEWFRLSAVRETLQRMLAEQHKTP